MSAKDKTSKTGSVQTHGIGMSRDLAWSVISDQAGGWKQSVREGGQNAHDAEGATEAHITFNTRFTSIRDNGVGRDLTNPDDRNLFINLGESDKKDDESKIGEFGIGKGQMWAIGVCKIVSGRQVLVYDVRRRGIDDDAVLQIEIPEEHAVDGTQVVIYHYDEQVPSEGSYRWERYEESLKQRFSYVSLVSDFKFYLNGECISDTTVDDAVSYKTTTVIEETPEAYIALQSKQSGSIKVFSNGIYVKDIRGEGMKGVVISKENLSLDIARNDIKERCQLWKQIREQLDEQRVSLINKLSVDNINSPISTYAISLAAENERFYDELSDIPLLQGHGDKNYTLSEVTSQSRIGFGGRNNVKADKVAQRGECVLDESVNAVQKFKNSSSFEKPPEFNVERVAHEEYNIHDGHEVINDLELKPRQRKYLAVAREMMGSVFNNEHYDVLWGEDNEAKAWTNGTDEIVLTETVFNGQSHAVWLPQLYMTLVHELSHDTNSKGSDTHDRQFYRKLGKTQEDSKKHFQSFTNIFENMGLRSFTLTKDGENLTENERSRLRELEQILVHQLNTGDKFYKNRQNVRCTVTDIFPVGGILEFKGPRGGEWVVVKEPVDGEMESRFIAKNRENGNTQEITHININ